MARRPRTINSQTYTPPNTQIGSVTGVTPSSQTQTQNGTTVDTNVQPFIRSQVVQVTGRAFKPSVRLYAFFDGTDVSSYITPCNSSFTATGAEGTAIYSDASGNVYCRFRIPNSTTARFRVGDRVFRLTDSPTNLATDVTTSAQAIYSAHVDVTPQVTIPTHTPVLTLDVSALNTDRIGFADPIAQSFTVDCRAFGKLNSSGAYITKVDLYFASKDTVQPVIIEIREVDPMTGYPTPKVVPFSRTVVEPSSINVSTDSSWPTPIYFEAPVWVKDETQYAIVVIPGGNNPNVSLWISRLGENDLITNNRVASQPATGILFASSNDTTYTAMQLEDIKFNLYFANFNVATTGNLILKNENMDFLLLSNTSSTSGFPTAGETVHGETYLKGTFANTQQVFPSNGSSHVQGMVSGADGILTYYSTANGEMRIKNVTPGNKFKGGEAVRIRLSSNTGKIVGNSTGGIKFATYPIGTVSYYDATTSGNTYLHVANVSYANSGSATGTSANNRTFRVGSWIMGQTTKNYAKIANFYNLNVDVFNVKADSILPSNTAIVPSSKFATSKTARETSYSSINFGSDSYFASRKYIYSKSVESNTSLSFSGMKDKSAEIKLTLSSNNRYGSPAIDLTRTHGTVVENLINALTANEANTATGGSAAAKYITRKVVLAEGQDAEDLVVYLDAYKPITSNVLVYYKVLHAEDSDTFDKARWMLMSQTTANTTYSSSEDLNDFIEYQYNVPAYPTGAVGYASGLYGNSSPSNVLYYRNSSGALFSGFKYFAIKIVLTGTTPTNPPRIKNLRAIALQK